PTWTLTATPTASPSGTPSETQTVTASPTASPTPTASPDYTATLSPTPAQIQVRIVILDQQRRVVADLGSYPSNGIVTSVFAEQMRFVPEAHRLQVFRDDQGGTATWNGAGDGAVP